MSFLVAIEGTDASGKKTQSDRLAENLRNMGIEVTELSFPDYDSPSSTLVKMYLGGEFGKTPDDTNAYAASMFFAADRDASFKKNWEKAYYDENRVIILNRYTTSNAVHQLAKIEDDGEKDSFLEWLCDFEFVKLGIPKPDMVIYLDMPESAARKLLEARSAETGAVKDIHEKSADHLKKAMAAAEYVIRKWGWTRIKCGEGSIPYTVEKIQSEVEKAVLEKLEERGITANSPNNTKRGK